MTYKSFIEEINSKGTEISASDVEIFETEIGHTLPTEYRDFLLETNGGFCGGSVWMNSHDVGVHHIGGLNAPSYRDLRGCRENDCSGVPKLFLWIMDDPFGNGIYICLEGDRRGEIYFNDHELPSPESGEPLESAESIWKIADSFSEFIENLKVPADEEPPHNERELYHAVKLGRLPRFFKALPNVKRGMRLIIYGNPLIHQASNPRAIKGQEWCPDVLRYMLENGIDPNTRNSKGATPLKFMDDEYPEVASILLEFGADPNIGLYENPGKTPLFFRFGKTPETLRLLIEAGGDLCSVEADKGNTPLHELAWSPFNIIDTNDKIELAELMFRNGADKTRKNANGHTPFDLLMQNIEEKKRSHVGAFPQLAGLKPFLELLKVTS